MLGVGLDPDDASTDLTTPIGIGNVAGAAVVTAREHDGMNQLGGRAHRPHGDPRRHWPALLRLHRVRARQHALQARPPGPVAAVDHRQRLRHLPRPAVVTPQYALVEPYRYSDVSQFNTPPPVSSDPASTELPPTGPSRAAGSAQMTDRQKMVAGAFDERSRRWASRRSSSRSRRALSLEEFVHYDFLTNLAAFDTGIAIWKEKRRYNAVRPFSAIRHLWEDQRHRVGRAREGNVQLRANQGRATCPWPTTPSTPPPRRPSARPTPSRVALLSGPTTSAGPSTCPRGCADRAWPPSAGHDHRLEHLVGVRTGVRHEPLRAGCISHRRSPPARRSATDRHARLRVSDGHQRHAPLILVAAPAGPWIASAAIARDVDQGPRDARAVEGFPEPAVHAGLEAGRTVLGTTLAVIARIGRSALVLRAP